ncbi:MAG: hypothetical protein HY656_02360 [Acidobacteria bacterium]|nr:hypothetical protein [Acidobacteriota bacterium]
MTLRELVARYKELAGGYGHPLHLSEFGLAKDETEREFSVYEEDYQIGRFFRLTRVPDEDNHPRAGCPPLYTINGFEYSHIAILPEIEEIL